MPSDSDNERVISVATETLQREIAAIQIVDDSSCLDAEAKLKAVVRLRKMVEAVYNPPVKDAAELLKRARGRKADRLQPVVALEEALRRAVGTFRVAQEQARRDEAYRLTRQISNEREQERRDSAMALEMLGDSAGAERVMSLPVPAPLVVVDAPVRTPDVPVYTHWVGEITDEAAFKRWCLESLNLHFLGIEMPAVNQLCARLKGATNVPGLRAVEKPIVQVRGT